MVNFVTLLVGPLAGPECRRALGRGWLIVVRVLAGLAATGVTLIALWYWWISQKIDTMHQPYEELRLALGVIDGMLVTVALVLGPAVLAGSLSGEKERGVLALLLTTRVRSWEVVAGRLVGKLAQVGMILLAGVPALVLVSSLAGVESWSLLAVLILPVGVGMGGAGLAALASTLSRRGRDALLAVYLIDVFLLLAPLLTSLGPGWAVPNWIAALNPYTVLEPLAAREELPLAWASIGLWLGIGVIGAAIASWRLRPSCLAPLDGERVLQNRRRRVPIPPVDFRRPMLWKELFIERVTTLGKFGRWAGIFLVVSLAGGSSLLTAVFIWTSTARPDPIWTDWAQGTLAFWVGNSGVLLGCLIQWAVGLRAAVSISSERERGTWDALLTSPLEGRAIVFGKLWGSLYALRWLVLSAFLAWVLAAATGAVLVHNAVRWGVEVVIIGAFMAAVGVRASLASTTATRAMSLTIGAWLVGWIAVDFAAALLLGTSLALLNLGWILMSQYTLVPPPVGPWLPLPWYVAWPLATNTLYLAATVVLVIDTRLRFDRLAGRMTEGRVSVALEEWLYGRPMEPVPIEPPRIPVEPAGPALGQGNAHVETEAAVELRPR